MKSRGFLKPTLIIFIILLILGLVIFFKPFTDTSAERVFAEFNLTLSKNPIINESTKLVTEIKQYKFPIGSKAKYKLQVFLPKGFKLLDGDLIWEGELIHESEEVVKIESNVMAIEEGDWVIEAIAFYQDLDNNLNYTPLETHYLWISIYNNTASVSDEPLKESEDYIFPESY